MMDHLTEETKKTTDRRFGKDKSKYKVGDTITDLTNEATAVFEVISVYKDNHQSNKTLYDIKNVFSGEIYYHIDTQMIGEIVTRKFRHFRGTYKINFLNEPTKI